MVEMKLRVPEELMERWKYGLYDSLVRAAALDGGCRTLFSEDLRDDQVVEGLTIANPLVA